MIDNKITKNITITILEIIHHLFENYGQVWKTTLNEQEQSVKTIVYILTEPLITVFIQIEYLQMLAKAAKNPYSDRQLVKTASRIIMNMNDFNNVQADWYNKTP